MYSFEWIEVNKTAQGRYRSSQDPDIAADHDDGQFLAALKSLVIYALIRSEYQISDRQIAQGPAAPREAAFAWGPAPRHSGAPMKRPLLTLACALGLALGACSGGTTPRGDARVGERCAHDTDCRRGLCVGGVAGAAPACTVSCATASDCPERWSCSAVTAQGVLVCQQGGATPFD